MAFIQPDLAVDLGSSYTSIYVKGRGLMLHEPTAVVAERADRHIIHAVGQEAKDLIGRTAENYILIDPVQHGLIADFDSTEILLRYFFRQTIGSSRILGPRVLVGVPSDIPAVSRKALREAILWAGARKVFFVANTFAAAIGTGLPVYEPVGSMVVSVGGGTTDAAVISLGGTVVSHAVPTGGQNMDEEIVNYLKKYSGMLIGDRTAEDVKIDLASAVPTKDERTVQVRGRNLLSSQAMVATLSSSQAHAAVKDPCMAVLGCIKWVLERTPPELSADIMRTGIHLTGGASQLYALDQFIGSQLSLPVYLARDPGDCTIRGLSYLLENPDLMESIISASEE